MKGHPNDSRQPISNMTHVRTFSLSSNWCWWLILPALIVALAAATAAFSANLPLDSRVIDQLPSILPVIGQDTETLHLVILVHGWLGNPTEMAYLKQTLQQQVIEDPAFSSVSKTAVVVHSAIANDGRTTDGIGAGGIRLAQEIDAIIGHYSRLQTQTNLNEISLSIVGNSLGGLYARYAVSEVQALQQPLLPSIDGTQRPKVTPHLFVTTCTPHLGVSQHTYLTLPKQIEGPIAWFLQRTGQDLFRRTAIVKEMATESKFRGPLSRFAERIAYANVFGTDFQVPTSTAAFWEDTDSEHSIVAHEESAGRTRRSWKSSNIVTKVSTPKAPSVRNDGDEDSLSISVILDQLGWTKVLVDVRPHVPSLGVPRFLQSSATTREDTETQPLQSSTTARELLRTYDKLAVLQGFFPLGHTVLVANAKDAVNRYLTKGGQSTMDYLAASMLESLFFKGERISLL